jgi:hypothetical protein
MQTRRKRILFSSAFLLFFLFPTTSLSQTSQYTNTPYLYKNKQDCLDKNIGPNGSPNDLIKLICDTVKDTEVSNRSSDEEKKSPEQIPIIKDRKETPEEILMRQSNDYYRHHRSEYEDAHQRKWDQYKKDEENADQIELNRQQYEFNKQIWRNQYQTIRSGMEYAAARGNPANPNAPNPMRDQYNKMSESSRQQYACSQLPANAWSNCPYW